ncbi:Endonuclease/exonuclease/phosphatase [Trema orientale]|uniref:Endonuclease/exonuclease/phosphatase n=1 Tax=Trema orientale TaxID=63057 RepID=A0A2P5FZZ8_TREOI|nr:Endonuclease/exonuclease/phosphatase [Trema orientale]
MKELWHPEKGMTIKEIGRKTFSFTFEDSADRDNVLDRESWNFNKIRVCQEVEAHENGKCLGRFVRIRVRLDISSPLQRGSQVMLGNDTENVWVDFRYERLPKFCFICGRLRASYSHRSFKASVDKRFKKNSSNTAGDMTDSAYGGSRRHSMERGGRISLQAIADSSALTSYKGVPNSDGRDFGNELVSDFNLNISSNSNLNSDGVILGKDSFVCDTNNQVCELDVRKEVVFGPDVSQQDKVGLVILGPVDAELKVIRKLAIVMDKNDLGPAGVSNKNSDDTLCSNFPHTTTLSFVGSENVIFSPPLTSSSLPPASSITIHGEVIFNAGSSALAMKGSKSKHWKAQAHDAHIRRSVSHGYFNTILCHDEKLGGSEKSNLSMNSFRRVLENCGLSDLGFEGTSMTWNNGRGGVANVQERLDRGVATSEWRFLFPGYKLSHLDFWGSDHRAVLLDVYPSLGGAISSSSGRGFRLEPT